MYLSSPLCTTYTLLVLPTVLKRIQFASIQKVDYLLTIARSLPHTHIKYLHLKTSFQQNHNLYYL